MNLAAGRGQRAVALCAALGVTWLHSVAEAQAVAPVLPARLRVTLAAPCSPPLFDADAYLRALDVELFAVGVARIVQQAAGAPEASAELTLSSPDCREQLLLDLGWGPRHSQHALQASELPPLGRERALALLSVERLQRAWPELESAEPAAEPAPVNAPPPAAATTPPAAPKPPPRARPGTRAKRPPPARGAERDAAANRRAPGQGALNAGLRFSTAAPLASLGFTLDRTLSRRFALGGALGWRSEHEGLADAEDATDAYSVTLGPRVELSLAQLDAVELAAAMGLSAGVGWVITAREGDSEARVSSSPAPLGLATFGLGVRAVLAYDVFVQLGATLDYALLGARFEAQSGRDLAELTGARFAAFVGAGARLGG